jgi:hypothetical protein
MPAIDEEQEERIHNEIIVDAYDDEEVQMGWYYYLQENLHFPFQAIYPIKQRSGGYKQQQVEVVELIPEEEFDQKILVGIAYEEDVFYVPLLDLQITEADEETRQAYGDWQYGKEHGYTR